MKKAMFIITLVFLLLFTGCHSREVPDVASEMHSSVEAVEYATEETVSSSESDTSSEVEDVTEFAEDTDKSMYNACVNYAKEFLKTKFNTNLVRKKYQFLK